MAPKTIMLSRKGMKSLKKAITQLERELAGLALQLKDVDKTDSKESQFERAELMNQRDVVEAKLQEKQLMLKYAKQLPSKRDVAKVAIGSIVELIDSTGRKVRYRIVDSFEANPLEGRISFVSPLGSSLIGKKVRDGIEWTRGTKHVHYQLVGIS